MFSNIAHMKVVICHTSLTFQVELDKIGGKVSVIFHGSVSWYIEYVASRILAWYGVGISLSLRLTLSIKAALRCGVVFVTACLFLLLFFVLFSLQAKFIHLYKHIYLFVWNCLIALCCSIWATENYLTEKKELLKNKLALLQFSAL